jgi:hypothetical protein
MNTHKTKAFSSALAGENAFFFAGTKTIHKEVANDTGSFCR